MFKRDVSLQIYGTPSFFYLFPLSRDNDYAGSDYHGIGAIQYLIALLIEISYHNLIK